MNVSQDTVSRRTGRYSKDLALTSTSALSATGYSPCCSASQWRIASADEGPRSRGSLGSRGRASSKLWQARHSSLWPERRTSPCASKRLSMRSAALLSHTHTHTHTRIHIRIHTYIHTYTGCQHRPAQRGAPQKIGLQRGRHTSDSGGHVRRWGLGQCPCPQHLLSPPTDSVLPAPGSWAPYRAGR